MQQAPADAEDFCLGIERDLQRPVLVALLRRIGEMLAPILDPLDRAAGEARSRDDRDVFRIDAELRAKTAADVGRRDTQPDVIEADAGVERVEQVVRLLGRGPGSDGIVGAVVLGEDAAAFDRVAGAAMLPELGAHDTLRGREGSCDVAVARP